VGPPGSGVIEGIFYISQGATPLFAEVLDLAVSVLAAFALLQWRVGGLVQ
jgi:hypothetical protein